MMQQPEEKKETVGEEKETLEDLEDMIYYVMDYVVRNMSFQKWSTLLQFSDKKKLLQKYNPDFTQKLLKMISIMNKTSYARPTLELLYVIMKKIIKAKTVQDKLKAIEPFYIIAQIRKGLYEGKDMNSLEKEFGTLRVNQYWRFRTRIFNTHRRDTDIRKNARIEPIEPSAYELSMIRSNSDFNSDKNTDRWLLRILPAWKKRIIETHSVEQQSWTAITKKYPKHSGYISTVENMVRNMTTPNVPDPHAPSAYEKDLGELLRQINELYQSGRTLSFIDFSQGHTDPTVYQFYATLLSRHQEFSTWIRTAVEERFKSLNKKDATKYIEYMKKLCVGYDMNYNTFITSHPETLHQLLSQSNDYLRSEGTSADELMSLHQRFKNNLSVQHKLKEKVKIIR